jgi:hypothetical protein
MASLLLLRTRSIRSCQIRGLSNATEQSFIGRIRAVLNHYWLGSKLLFAHFNEIRLLKQKSVKSLGAHVKRSSCPFDCRNIARLTRLEKHQLDQFRYDIRVGIPFVGLFSLPIVGYTAPLLAIVAPRYLPSTLIWPEQKVRECTRLLIGTSPSLVSLEAVRQRRRAHLVADRSFVG